MLVQRDRCQWLHGKHESNKVVGWKIVIENLRLVWGVFKENSFCERYFWNISLLKIIVQFWKTCMCSLSSEKIYLPLLLLLPFAMFEITSFNARRRFRKCLGVLCCEWTRKRLIDVSIICLYEFIVRDVCLKFLIFFSDGSKVEQFKSFMDFKWTKIIPLML